MKTIIYARVSTQEQAEGKFSIETQIADGERHCQRQGDTVVKTYVDIQSGRDGQKDREQFEQMLKDAKSGLFDKIVVWRPDRLFRGLTPAAKLARMLDETGIGIEGVLQPLDRNMIGLWAWVAEQEIEGLKERFEAGKRANARELGKWGGGFIRYGYRYNADRKSDNYTGKLEIDETEAKVVLGMFESIAQGGTITEWVNWANEEGIPTKHNGKGWTKSLVSRMLRDTTYIALGHYGKEKRRGNKLVKGDNPVPMSYPQIIPRELFDKVQIRLGENKRKNDGSSKRTYMLMHLGRCGECGGRLQCRSSQSKGYRGHSYLYCGKQLAFPHLHQCYQPKYWRLDLIEDYIWAEVEDVLDKFQNGTYGVLIDRFEDGKEEREKQVVRVKNEVDRCKLERQRMLTALRKGYTTEVEAELQFTAIKCDQEYWELELVRLEVLKANSDAIWDSWWSQVKQIDKWFDYGFILGLEEKKKILNTLLEEFVLYRDGRIELRFRVPVNEKQVAETIATLSHDNVA